MTCAVGCRRAFGSVSWSTRRCGVRRASTPNRRRSRPCGRCASRPAERMLSDVQRSGQPVFVGRDAELATLTTALESAVAGTPTVVLLGGEAGVGKTRLVEEAAARARAAGARVLAGSCVELGGEGLPFGPLAHALRSLMRDTSPEQLDALLGPGALGVRARAARPRPGRRAPHGAARPRAARRACSSSSLGVIERLAADRPLMFVIEDLHWADRSTLDLVALLVRALRAARVLVVVSFRSDELHRSHPLRPLVTGWERVRSVHRIELERFGREEVARQLAAILGAPPGARLVDLVHERSEGNAFLVEEILGAVQSGADPDQLPLSLRDVLLARVERLSAGPPSGCCGSRRRRARRCPIGCSPPSPASGTTSSTPRCARPSSTTCSWSTRPTAATCSAMRSPATPSTATRCRASACASTRRTARRCPPTRRSPAGTSPSPRCSRCTGRRRTTCRARSRRPSRRRGWPPPTRRPRRCGTSSARSRSGRRCPMRRSAAASTSSRRCAAPG